jgi:hypothetical protein
MPAFLRDLPTPTKDSGRNDDLSWGIVAAVLAQRGEIQFPEAMAGELARYDPTLAEMFSLDWFGKYNPDYISLIPPELRNPILNQFHEFGIYPYGEADWQEIALSRQVICSYSFAENDVMSEMCPEPVQGRAAAPPPGASAERVRLPERAARWAKRRARGVSPPPEQPSPLP